MDSAFPLREASQKLSETNQTPAITPAATMPEPPTTQPSVAIVSGYRPGILARTLQLHMDEYYPNEAWGVDFEASIAKGMGNVLTRLDKRGNRVWSAIMTIPSADPGKPPLERIMGAIYVNGDYYDDEDVARLQYFIADPSARGMGIGKRLFGAAMEYLREDGFRECHLSTLERLTAARKLYERGGFKQTGERWPDGFGKGVAELTYTWQRPDGE